MEPLSHGRCYKIVDGRGGWNLHPHIWSSFGAHLWIFLETVLDDLASCGPMFSCRLEIEIEIEIVGQYFVLKFQMN